MNNHLIKLDDASLENYSVGEPITLASVMALVAVAIVAVIVYRLFLSGGGKVSLPGGFKFEWN